MPGMQWIGVLKTRRSYVAFLLGNPGNLDEDRGLRV